MAPEQPQLAIRIPITVCNPTAKEPHLSRTDPARILLRAAIFEKALNLGEQLRRNFLIGIEGENPWLGAMAKRHVFLIAKT